MADKPRFEGERVRVSDVFDLQMGKTPSRKEPAYWNNGDYEWVSIKDLGTCGKYVGSTRETISELGRKESGIKPVPASTLIMSFKLSLGKTAITTRETYTNEAIMAFVDKGRYPFSLDYMWHQFRSKDWTAGTNAAVMGKTLNKKTLGAATIAVPPIEEQISIARRLDYLQELTGQSECQLALLDALVKSRFVEMFGGALSIENKWGSSILENCVESLESGKSPSCKNTSRKGSDPGVLKLSALSSGRFLSGENKAMLDGETIIQAKEVKQGDILLARKNTPQLVGSCVLVRENVKNLMFPDIVFRMHPNDSVNGEYLAALLSGPSYSNKVRGLAHGSNKSMSNIPKSELARLSIPLPPLSLQQQFADFVAQVDKSRFIAQQQIEKLQMLYDSLAQEYFA